MSRLKDIALAVFVSFEFLCLLTVLALYTALPQLFVWIGTRLSGADDRIRYFCFVPVAVLALVVRSSKDLLFPSESDCRLLQEWPKYRMVRDRYFVSVVWAAGCALAGPLIWGLKLPVSDKRFVAAAVAAIAISLVDYGCLFVATLTVREILGPKAPNPA